MHKLFLILCLLISINTEAQFTGESGVYYLGTANIPISITNYSNPNINGVVVRFTWDVLEPTPNNFNWTFIDGEITKAITYNKKISLQPLGVPHWLDSIGVQQYYYIDKNTAHSTYGHIVSNVLPWDSIYVIRYKNLLQQLAVKYSSNPTVSYINAIGVAFSRGLPDTVLTDTTLLIKQPFWTAYNYNADTLGLLMNHITDYYMALFPSTPLWCSVDYVIFQPNATGQARNYLATIYCNYGITNYSDRFGLFREDISACNPPSSVSSGSQWYIMQQNHCRTGAQMLWSVQDGPTRMNPCGILPNTKAIVLDSSVNKGLSYGMRYLEIYGADISDASLTTSIQQANTKLIAKGLECNPSNDINQQTKETGFSIYPNPATVTLNISFWHKQSDKQQIEIYNSIGLLIKEIAITDAVELNIANLPIGLYFIHCKNNLLSTQKFIKQ
ncbi:MAG: T9SS type A sorting domain-containing protein [Bacteroidetes bacterium]|nr:T9SS type A sorting domain-containing protein [Bacteroidota bacterium]